MKEVLKREGKHIVIFSVLMVAILVFYAVSMSGLAKKNDLKHLTADDFSFVFQVDSVADDGKNVTLNGWAFSLKQDATDDDIELLLYDMEEEKIVYPKQKNAVREDVNQYFLCEYDYSKSGFEATANSKKLDLQNKDYEVLISVKDKKKVYQTGTYISKGELMYANPKEFVPLDVTGTGLEQIVEDGALRVYRPDFNMYVYQYEGDLYWIAELGYAFEEDGNTYFEYQMNTTQVDKLPQHCLEKGWFWSDLRFVFENQEIFDVDAGRYRMTREKLPQEYSVTNILTGYYVDDWIWKSYFRPWYDL